MKKLILLFTLILCVGMLFVSCNKNANDNEEDTKPTDNVNNNIDMLVEELNKYQTADELVGAPESYLKYEELVDELKRISAEGNADVSIFESGKKLGTANAEFAIKNNNFYASATNNADSTVGVNAKITNDMKLALVAWGADSRNDVDIQDSFALDIKEAFDEYALEVNNSMNITLKDMPVELSEVKLPTFTSEHITAKNGKYMLSKDFLCEAFITTFEGIVDSIKNNGEELPEDFEEEYDEILKTIEKVCHAIELEVYFYVKNEVINGAGIDFKMSADKIAQAVGEDVSSFDPVEYVEISYEATNKGASFYLEYKEREKDANHLSFDMSYYFDGKKLDGFSAKYSLYSEESSSEEASNGYVQTTIHKKEIMDQSISIDLKLSNLEKKNAEVLSAAIEVNGDKDATYKYFIDGEEVYYTQEVQSSEQNYIGISIRTTDAYKGTFSFEINSKTKEVNDGISSSDKTDVGFEGNYAIDTENVILPEVDTKVADEINKLISN